MANKPLAILRKGLSRLQEKIKKKRDELTAKLSRQEHISSIDEQWLDNEGNTVDEERVVDLLESASDYQRGLQCLSTTDKKIVDELKALAGGEGTGNKRKRSNYASSTKAPTEKPVPAAPVFTGKQTASLRQRIEILDWHHKNGKNQTKTARHFDKIYPNLCLKQPLVSEWVKRESKIRHDWEKASTEHERSAKRVRQTEHPEVTEMMGLWIENAMHNKVLLTGEVLRQQWIRFADLLGIPAEDRLKLSNGWLDSMKSHYCLKKVKFHGEAGSVDPEAVGNERARVQELLNESGYQLRDIYNMDETGLFYGMAPDSGLSNSKHAGVKGTKIRLTYAFTANADGSHKLPPLVIGKAACPRAFNRKSALQLGFLYRNNVKAWMTTDIYQEWIRQWDNELKAHNRKIILLQDNFAGHVVPSGLECIRVENFKPNLTSHVQPMDQGIIRCFKAHYRARFIQRAIDRYNEGISPADIYEINQLEAMRLADVAWKEIDTTTIRNCWKKAGILPDIAAPPPVNPSVPISALLHTPQMSDPVAQAEIQVEHALDGLISTGALQTVNRMAIESLLNMKEESQHMVESSDEEIYQSVIDAVRARDNIEINGGDDVDDGPSDPPPHRRDVLKAVATINRYTSSLDEPFARKMEAILRSFNRQIRIDETQSMKETLMTDYFSRRV